LISIKLIEPSIALATVRRRIPELTWAAYPRSIATPPTRVASRIRKLIMERRKKGILDLDDDALATTKIDELRRIALARARPFATPRERKIVYRTRSRAIHLYVLSRADGCCEGCGAFAPFRKADGSPYLEPHHVTRLADDGPDHPAKVIALCPNCHRRAHHSRDAKGFHTLLVRTLADLEPKRA
jgi:5-methylcytosine-specific restriction protein A